MADNSLRGLAKAYFNGDYEWDIYLQERSQLIDKITEAPIVGNQSSTPIVKYAIVAGMILLFVGGALGVFWVLKEKPKEVSVPLIPEVVEQQKVPLEEVPFYEPDPQEESAGSRLNEEESQAANTDDIDARSVEPEPQFVETKAPVLLVEPTQEALTEPDKEKIDQLLRECNKHLKADRLVTGNGGTALVCYKDVLAIDSDNTEALDGLKAIEQRYENWAERALNKKRFTDVKTYLERLETVNPDSAALAELKQRLEAVQ